MLELRIRTYSKSKVLEQERDSLIKDLIDFADNISNLKKDDYNIEVREGSLEIVVVAAIGVAIWLTKEVGKYELKRGLDKLHQKSDLQENSSGGSGFSGGPDVMVASGVLNPVIVDKTALEKAIELKEMHQLNSFSIGTLKEDGSGNVVKIHGASGKVNLDLHQTEKQEDYYRLFDES